MAFSAICTKLLFAKSGRCQVKKNKNQKEFNFMTHVGRKNAPKRYVDMAIKEFYGLGFPHESFSMKAIHVRALNLMRKYNKNMH